MMLKAAEVEAPEEEEAAGACTRLLRGEKRAGYLFRGLSEKVEADELFRGNEAFLQRFLLEPQGPPLQGGVKRQQTWHPRRT